MNNSENSLMTPIDVTSDPLHMTELILLNNLTEFNSITPEMASFASFIVSHSDQEAVDILSSGGTSPNWSSLIEIGSRGGDDSNHGSFADCAIPSGLNTLFNECSWSDPSDNPSHSMCEDNGSIETDPVLDCSGSTLTHRSPQCPDDNQLSFPLAVRCVEKPQPFECSDDIIEHTGGRVHAEAAASFQSHSSIASPAAPPREKEIGLSELILSFSPIASPASPALDEEIGLSELISSFTRDASPFSPEHLDSETGPPESIPSISAIPSPKSPEFQPAAAAAELSDSLDKMKLPEFPSTTQKSIEKKQLNENDLINSISRTRDEISEEERRCFTESGSAVLSLSLPKMKTISWNVEIPLFFFSFLQSLSHGPALKEPLVNLAMNASIPVNGVAESDMEVRKNIEKSILNGHVTENPSLSFSKNAEEKIDRPVKSGWSDSARQLSHIFIDDCSTFFQRVENPSKMAKKIHDKRDQIIEALSTYIDHVFRPFVTNIAGVEPLFPLTSKQCFEIVGKCKFIKFQSLAGRKMNKKEMKKTEKNEKDKEMDELAKYLRRKYMVRFKQFVSDLNRDINEGERFERYLNEKVAIFPEFLLVKKTYLSLKRHVKRK
jgi:hypothetical protein